MRAAGFWKAVTVDRSNVLERFFEVLRRHDVPFCPIDGQALNAYVEPVLERYPELRPSVPADILARLV
jgi:hypothetical protein